MNEYSARYRSWLEDEFFSEDTRAELTAITGNDDEIKERFYKELEFGTGGLRGKLGAGTNRMNIYTVGKATQGLCNYVLKQGISEPAAAVSYDSRRMSPEFAKSVAKIFCANGIRTYLFGSIHPTPLLSFAVRRLNCVTGVMITASHNPPEDNGYKAYWADGGQLSFPMDEEVISEVNAVENYTAIKSMELDAAEEAGLFRIISPELDDEFIELAKAQRVMPEISETTDLSIVYTPLHGTGGPFVRRVLDECGYKNLLVVPEQAEPDSAFPTLNYPNPEDPAAFACALKYAEERKADVLVATDPDADRVGVFALKSYKADAVFSPANYARLSGNETGALLIDYILRYKREKGLLPKNPALVSTIVSTRLAKEICEKTGVEYFDVLTGFKNIAKQMLDFEKSGHNYVFGFEESFGYLPAGYCRDKNSVDATLLICEMSAWYKSRGLTLHDGLDEIGQRYGYFTEDAKSVVLPGIDGIEKMKAIMNRLRNSGIKEINKRKIALAADYLTGQAHDYSLDVSYATGLPLSDVLRFVTTDDDWFCIRPSGTEPKIKLYFGSRGKTKQESLERLDKFKAAVLELVGV